MLTVNVNRLALKFIPPRLNHTLKIPNMHDSLFISPFYYNHYYYFNFKRSRHQISNSAHVSGFHFSKPIKVKWDLCISPLPSLNRIQGVYPKNSQSLNGTKYSWNQITFRSLYLLLGCMYLVVQLTEHELLDGHNVAISSDWHPLNTPGWIVIQIDIFINSVKTC